MYCKKDNSPSSYSPSPYDKSTTGAAPPQIYWPCICYLVGDKTGFPGWANMA